MQNDIDAAMLKSADGFAEKAEKLHDTTFIAMSFSLRLAAKTKK